jgi:hypothetical protein
MGCWRDDYVDTCLGFIEDINRLSPGTNPIETLMVPSRRGMPHNGNFAVEDGSRYYIPVGLKIRTNSSTIVDYPCPG